MKIKYSKEEKRKIINYIQDFFHEERGEEIGIIAAENVFDFFSDKIGNMIYNKALDDARVWYAKRLEDIEIDFDLLYK